MKLRLKKYQKIGIRKCMRFLDTLRTAYIADQMGLGKTCQAIILAKLRHKRNILVICPASLQLVWPREFKKWYKDYDGLLTVKSYTSLLQRKNLNPLLMQQFDLIIYDESHYLKNIESKRTQICLGPLWKVGDEVIYLSGTPIKNCAAETWPIFARIMPNKFGNFYKFKQRYCNIEKRLIGSYYDRSGIRRFRYADKVTGIRNKEELDSIAKSNFMVRNLTRDVLPELPEITYQNFEVKLTKKDLASCRVESAIEARILAAVANGQHINLRTEAVARVKRLIGICKVKETVKHILNVLESEKNVVVFAYHKEVIRQISEALAKKKVSHGVLCGDTPLKQRQQVVDAFQAKEIQVFLGQIEAAGVGLTLTAARVCIFAEQHWSPSDMSQAVYRLQRIGQKSNVLAYFIVAQKTIDERILKVLQNKMQAVSAFDTREESCQTQLNYSKNS